MAWRRSTDDDGFYEIVGIESGRARVWAHASGYRYSFTEPIDVEPGGRVFDVDLDLLELAVEERIAGRVLDPDGNPVPRAKLTYTYISPDGTGFQWETAEADGSFLIPVRRAEEHTVRAEDPEGRWGGTDAVPVKPGAPDVLLLQLEEPTAVELQVRDETGTPVETYAFRVFDPGHPRMGGIWSHSAPEALHEDGRATVELTGARFSIEVDVAGYARTSVGPFEPDAVPDMIECALDAPSGLRGTVTAAGEPVGYAEVMLYKLYPDDAFVTGNGFRMIRRVTPVSSARTDTAGHFHVQVPDVGSFVLAAEARAGSAEFGPFAHVEGPVELTLGHGGAIEGSVLVPSGSRAVGTIVGVNRGDGKPRTVRVGPDGRYRFEGLAPGPWEVRVCGQEAVETGYSVYHTTGNEPPPPPWVCDVIEGETTLFDVDLREREPCRLSGRLIVAAGADEWTASLWPGYLWGERGTARVPAVALDPSGEFELEMNEPGRHRLHLSRTTKHGEQQLSAAVRLEPGANTWEIELPLGSLSGDGAGLRQAASVEFYHVWRGPLRSTCLTPIQPDLRGEFALNQVPAGRARIVRYDAERGALDPEFWTTVMAVDVPVGGKAEAHLP